MSCFVLETAMFAVLCLDPLTFDETFVALGWLCKVILLISFSSTAPLELTSFVRSEVLIFVFIFLLPSSLSYSFFKVFFVVKFHNHFNDVPELNERRKVGGDVCKTPVKSSNMTTDRNTNRPPIYLSNHTKKRFLLNLKKVIYCSILQNYMIYKN